TLAEMDVDIIIDVTPDQGTIAQEQFAEVMRLAGANPAWAQQLTLLDAIELSSIPHKRSLVDRLKQRQEEAQQAAAAAAQKMAEKADAEIEETRASADLKGAQAANEMMHPHMEAAAALEAAAMQPPPADTGAPDSFPPSPQAEAGP